MGRSWDTLRNRLVAALEPYGAVSEFCRKTGFARSGVERWLRNEGVPGLDALDRIADGLDTQAWEVIRPDDAHAAPKSDLSAALATLDNTELGLVLKYIATLKRVAANHNALPVRKKKL